MAKKTRQPLLTQAKSKWAAKLRSPTLRGAALNPNAAVADRYNQQLQALISQMADQTERAIAKLFTSDVAEQHFGTDASISSQARILLNGLRNTFESLFSKRAKYLASQMVNGSDKASKSSLHGSLKDLSGGLSIKTDLTPPELQESLGAALADNVNLIKTIPSSYMDDIFGAVMRSVQAGGNGLQDLIPHMKQYKMISQRHAKNVALDQTRKAFNNASAIRLQAIGVKKFEWIHSGGGAHPRQDHVDMSGNIYSFDDLPIIGIMYGSTIRGIPGQLPNCRCTMSPVIDFEED